MEKEENTEQDQMPRCKMCSSYNVTGPYLYRKKGREVLCCKDCGAISKYNRRHRMKINIEATPAELVEHKVRSEYARLKMAATAEMEASKKESLNLAEQEAIWQRAMEANRRKASEADAEAETVDQIEKGLCEAIAKLEKEIAERQSALAILRRAAVTPKTTPHPQHRNSECDITTAAAWVAKQSPEQFTGKV